MMKNTLVQLSVAVVLGATAGFYLLSTIQEPWFSVLLGIVVCISVFGIINYYKLLFPRTSSNQSAWHFILTVLMVGVMFTPQASRVIETQFLYPTMFFFWGILLSGATIGIAIARHSQSPADE